MTIPSTCCVCGKNALRDPDSSFCSAACAAKYTSMISGLPPKFHEPPPKTMNNPNDPGPFPGPLYTKGRRFDEKIRDDIVYTLNDDAMKIGIDPGAGDFAMTDWQKVPEREILDSLIGHSAQIHPDALQGLKRRQGYIPLSDTEVNDAVRRFLPHTLTALEKEISKLNDRLCHKDIEIFTLKAELDHCRRCHQG